MPPFALPFQRFDVFFQAEFVFHDAPRMLLSHIADVPGLAGYAGDLLFIRGKANDKSIFSTMLLDPFFILGAFKIVQAGSIADHQVKCQSGLVLAFSRPGQRPVGQLFRLRSGIALIGILLNFFFKQRLLLFICLLYTSRCV